MATAVRDRPQLEPFAGIYTAPNAARYIRATMPEGLSLTMTSTKLLRWIRHGLGSSEYRGVPGRDILIDFEDLVSMRVITAWRACGVGWPTIRGVEERLREFTDAPKPFATSVLWHGAGELFSDRTERPIATNRYERKAFELLYDHIFPVSGLTFDTETYRAMWWEPLSEVRLNPKVQFGSPCIAGTRVPTSAVYGSVAGGDSKESMPDDYGITMKQVEAALDWESRIRAA